MGFPNRFIAAQDEWKWDLYDSVLRFRDTLYLKQGDRVARYAWQGCWELQEVTPSDQTTAITCICPCPRCGGMVANPIIIRDTYLEVGPAVCGCSESP